MVDPKDDPNQGFRDKLKEDVAVAGFIEEGKKLLEETNRPNVITLAQFEPFLPLFNVDKENYKTDPVTGRGLNDYSRGINNLFKQWSDPRALGINLYEVTYVIHSREDQRVIYYLDRMFSRIRSDHVQVGTSNRETVGNLPRSPMTTRDELVLSASTQDLLNANQSPEQTRAFQTLRMESSVITKNFTELNTDPNKRVEPGEATVTSTTASGGNEDVVFLDEDD